MKPIDRTITDYLNEKSNLKPIQLVACFQDSEKHCFLFNDFGSHLRMAAKTIKRVGQIVHQGKTYDVIITNDSTLFLGHWNDGVVE